MVAVVEENAKMSSLRSWWKREMEERKRMIGGIDNMWLLLTEAAEFNPTCTATFTYRGRMTLEKLERKGELAARKFPRFKQKLVSIGRNFHSPHFEDDPNFDVKNHVEAVRLPEPAGKKELEDLLGDYTARPWDISRPLWDILLVENYHDEDGAESAMITRGHHTLADGQGFVISELYSSSFHDELVEMMEGGKQQLQDARRGKLQASKIHPALKRVEAAQSDPLTAPFVAAFLALLFWLNVLTSFLVSLGWSTYQSLHQGAMLLLTCWRADMVTGYQPGPRVAEREYAQSRTISIDDVKLCQRAFSGSRPGVQVKKRSKHGHVTLNDVVCAVMVDVLAKEIAAKQADRGPWGKTKEWLKTFLPSPIGFFIPISVREPGDWSMRNLATGSLTYLYPAGKVDDSISIKELHAHIHGCHRELSLLKHSMVPKLLFKLLQLTAHAPILLKLALQPKSIRGWRRIWRQIVTVPSVKTLELCTVVLTNVPGPKGPVSVEGLEVVKWTALPPQAGKGTLGIGVMSYAGGISISVLADAVPSSKGVARRICEDFEKRFELYVARARDVVKHEE